MASLITAGFVPADAPAAHAQEAPAAQVRKVSFVTTAPPPEFATLSGPQQAVVDVYFGGRRLGQADVVFQPGSIRFADPVAVAGMVPDVADRATVEKALSAQGLLTHARLVCSRDVEKAGCGTLSPEVVGVIFDESRFRLDLFVNPGFLAVRSPSVPSYLPAPDSGLAFVNAVGGVVAGTTGNGTVYNLQNRLAIGAGSARLRADTTVATGFGFQADALVAELDRPGWRFSAGSRWSPGSDFLGRFKILGLGIETQIDTRADREEIHGIPLIVFLNQRSRVDILRDGRVLASANYEAGNQRLDTSYLPEGSYEVILRISEASGAQREERRFFARTRAIAGVGEARMHAFAGVLVDEQSGGFLTPTRTRFAQLAYGRRVSPSLAADVMAQMVGRSAYAEAGVWWINPVATVRLAAVASTNGDTGALLRVSSTGSDGLNFNFDLRRLAVVRAEGAVHGRAALGTPSFGEERGGLFVLPGTFTEAAGNLSYSGRRGQVTLFGSWRRDQSGDQRYTLGSTMRWDAIQRGNWRLALTAGAARTDQGNYTYGGVTVRLLGRRSTLSASSGVEHATPLDGHRGAVHVGSVSGSLEIPSLPGGELSVSAGYERGRDRQVLTAGADMRTRLSSIRADFARDLSGQGNTQYSLAFDSTIIAGRGRLKVEGRNHGDSAVIVDIAGDDPESRFEVLLDEGSAGTLRSGQSLAILLPPYREYDLRVRQLSGGVQSYDGATRKVTLLPGNVAKVSWRMRRSNAWFARVVDASGAPLAHAWLSAGEDIAQSDAGGFFQLQAPAGAVVNVSPERGERCQIELPVVPQPGEFSNLGSLTCVPDRSRIARAVAP